ncbi:MAG: hypothetical protein LBG97_05990 [Coriobacteriales bacterium]|nr:hypothetical protein [Coriobacteriales bacterium]
MKIRTQRCQRTLLRPQVLLAVVVCLALVLSTLYLPSWLTSSRLALAEPSSDEVAQGEELFVVATTGADTSPKESELQRRVEETTLAYNESVSKVADIQKQIDELQIQIDTIEKELPLQRARSNEAAAEYYRLQCSGNMLLELLFSSNSIADFSNRLEYISRLQESYRNQIGELNATNARLQKTQSDLEVARQEAVAESVRAQEALNDATAVREEHQRQAEAAARAQEAAMAAQLRNHDGSNAAVAVADSVDWNVSKEEFVATWAERIDNYLMYQRPYNPLRGYGHTFASAAWEYHVDPRVAVAISTNETGNGSYPPAERAHNAWGWIGFSWPDWETAIWEYTAGFSRGYGYTITLEGAMRYAPEVYSENPLVYVWEVWYPIVVNEMSKI